MEKTKQYLKTKFQEYYIKHNIPAPLEIDRREFCFWLDPERKSLPIRSKSFKSENELNQYLRSQQSLFHISYSTAYYEFPENEIARKGWLGADLIFDFDIKTEFIELKKIEEIWNEILKLLDFLTVDFGFSSKDIKVNFSGSKGFHVKVFDEKIKKLGKEERREILDYVTANGLLDDIKKSKFFSLEPKWTMKTAYMESKTIIGKQQRFTTETPILIGPTINDVGWGRRIAEVAIEILKEDENNKHIGEERRKKIKEIRKDVEKGNYDKFREYLKDKQMKNKIKERAVRLTADTDRQITQDISRLIRLENTLHGGTGLIAKKIDNIENFNVERDFKEFVAFDAQEVEILLDENQKFWLLNDFEIRKGINKVPEYAAIYLMLKGKGRIL